MWPNDPSFTEEPEAVIAVTKFGILKSIGAGYTFSSIDDEKYINLLYISECSKWYNKKMEMQNNHADFYSKEAMR